MGKIRFWLFLVVLLSSISPAAFAQPGDPPPVPITGIEILLMAGSALGIKRLLDNRRTKK
jgi:hypothetical protein